MKEQSLPIVPWIGGKRRLAKHILPLFPAHTCYVEPFCGAAALYFLKTPSKTEVINDINGELVNLYRVVKHQIYSPVQMGAGQPSDLQMVAGYAGRNAHRHSAGGPVLLPAETGIWRQGRRSHIRYLYNQCAALQFAAY